MARPRKMVPKEIRWMSQAPRIEKKCIEPDDKGVMRVFMEFVDVEKESRSQLKPKVNNMKNVIETGKVIEVKGASSLFTESDPVDVDNIVARVSAKAKENLSKIE